MTVPSPQNWCQTEAPPLCYEKLFKCFYLSLKSIIQQFYPAFLGFVYKNFVSFPNHTKGQLVLFANQNSRRIDLKFNRIVYQPTTLNTRKGNKSHKKLRCKVKLIAIISYIHGAHSISYAHTHTHLLLPCPLSRSRTPLGGGCCCAQENTLFISYWRVNFSYKLDHFFLPLNIP